MHGGSRSYSHWQDRQKTTPGRLEAIRSDIPNHTRLFAVGSTEAHMTPSKLTILNPFSAPRNGGTHVYRGIESTGSIQYTVQPHPSSSSTEYERGGGGRQVGSQFVAPGNWGIGLAGSTDKRSHSTVMARLGLQMTSVQITCPYLSFNRSVLGAFISPAANCH